MKDCVWTFHSVLGDLIMSFNLDNPGFSASSPSDTQPVSTTKVLLQPPTASSPSTPSSGESTRRLYPRCHGGMSSLALDKHTFCFKCHGADCNSQNKCIECMSWSSGEMEAYVKLRKSLASKSRKPKSGSSKPPSSPKSVAPIAHDVLSDVGSLMTGQFD